MAGASNPHPASLKRLIALLPSPRHPLSGSRTAPLLLPDNIICFRRRSAADLNRPQRGRALHHRFVRILALQTAVTVLVDDRAIRLNANQGLLIFPFQFHDYIEPAQPELNWLFVTFELIDDGALAALRFRPFMIKPAVGRLAAELVEAYLQSGEANLTALLLALLLARVRHAAPARRQSPAPPVTPGLITQVNQLVRRRDQPLSIKEIAGSLGISASHLRARFRISCGVSLGRHLRRLRLEKACGLLRLSPSRVSEVADLCGFTSIYNFSRAFRNAYGVSPLAYRQGDRGRPSNKA